LSHLDRRVVRSKEALKQALLQLMRQKDFSAISITEIVAAANYNRGTFYSHYDSKEALLAEFIEDLIQDLLMSFRAPYEHEEIFRIDELTANSVQIFEHIHQHATDYTILLRSNVMPQLREQMFTALKRISLEELEYPENGIDRELLAHYSINGLLGLILYWIEGGFAYTPAYMQEQLIKMIHWHPTEAKTRKPGAPPRRS